MTDSRYVRESRCMKSSHILPPDTNNHQTLYGGKLMDYIDNIAALSAMKHSRSPVVTASIDSLDFLRPVKADYEVCLESYVTWTHITSMEVFVKISAENLLTGDRSVCATSFLTFVKMGPDDHPTPVPKIIPETKEEKFLHETAPRRARARQLRRTESLKLAETLGTKRPWEIYTC